jgi:putative ABC transport system permease protein
MGTNLLTIKAGQVRKMVKREFQFGEVTTLRVKDAEAIAREIPLAEAVAPMMDRDLKVKYGSLFTRTKIIATTSPFREIRNYKVARGRFFSEDENRAGLRTAVLGSDVCKNLFNGRDPIGETIRIGKVPFEVIGVLASKGASPDGANEDDRVFIPIRTALRRVFNIRHLRVIYVRVRDRALMDRAEQEIRELLRERHRLVKLQRADDFTIRNQVTALEVERESGDSFTLLIAGIAAIALLVGGIGILAIMLLAVKERTGEIGLRRAVGARSRDILTQFLLEALFLGLAGGLAGMFMGVAGAWVIGKATGLAVVIPIDAIGLAFLFLLSVGLFFGVYPARKASLMDPIDALRAS